jgi:uncharacterized protein YkwD
MSKNFLSILVIGLFFAFFPVSFHLTKVYALEAQEAQEAEEVESQELNDSSPAASPTIKPAAAPTATPTPKPITAQTPRPTQTQTPRPLVVSTPRPSATVTPRPAATPTPTTTLTHRQKQDYIMNAINSYRASQDLHPVENDTYTCNFAKIRAKEISTNFSHAGFRSRIDSKTLPYPSYRLITENIAITSDYKRVVTMWINSPGHALNMRRDTPLVCVEFYGNYYAYEGWKP